MRLSTSVSASALCGICLLLASATAVSAVTYTWDGAGGDQLWSNAGNWGGTAPSSASTTTVQFDGIVGLSPNQDIADPFELNRLEFLNGPTSGGKAAFNISGDQLHFVDDGSTSPRIYLTRQATCSISNDIQIDTGTTLYLEIGTYGVTFNGVISGGGSIDKLQNAGGISLNNSANSFSGGLTIRATNNNWYKVNINASGAMGTGDVELYGGSLGDFPNPGGLIFYNTTTHANDINLHQDSPIFVGMPTGTANVTLNGNVDLNNNTLYLRGGGTGTINGVISSTGGPGGLVKMDPGTWNLNGANTFTGPVAVNDGVIVIGHKEAFGTQDAAATKVVVASGATVELNGVRDAGFGYTIAGTGHYGTGAIINTGAGINNSTLQMSNLTLSDDAMIGGTGNFALLAPSYAATTLDLAGHTLTKAGSNTFTITNTTLTAGAIHIAEGTFSQHRRAHDASAVAFTLDNTAGATLALGSYNLEVGSLAGGGSTGGNVNLGANTLTVGALGTSTTYSGVISGGGGLTKTGDGTLTLGGANTFTGPVAVNDGVVVIGNKDAFGADNTAVTKVVIASGATVDFNGVADAKYGYTIAGTGHDGTGAIVNTGANIGNNYLQSSNITLSADAMIGGTGNFALLAQGHGATTLDLAGHTLTKAGTNTFTVDNATLTAGTIHIAGGTFSQYTRAHDAGAVAFTLDDTAGATLALGAHDLAVGSLAGGGTTGGNVNLGANTLTVGALGTSTTYAGVISGGGSLIKTGAGTLTLDAANTYSGGTTISGGTIAVTGTGAGGAADDSVNALGQSGAPVVIEGAGTLTLTNVVSSWSGANYVYSGAGTLNLVSSGGGAYTQLDGSLSGFTGTINVSGDGYNTFRNATDASNATVNVTTTGFGLFLRNADNMQLGALTGNGNIKGGNGVGNATLTVGNLNTDTTFSGAIGGGVTAIALTKVGDGTLTLSGANTFTGNVAINDGVVVIGNQDAFGARNAAPTKVVVASGATVELNGVIDAGFGYTIAGTGHYGTGAIINSGANIGTGTLQMSNLTLSADAMIGGTGNFALLAPGHAATTLDLAGHTLTKAGTNTFTIDNATLTAGTIHIAEGTFAQYTRGHDAGAVAFTLDDTAGATLALGSYNLSVGSLAGGGTTGGNVNLGASTLTVGALGTSTTYSGVISGGGNLAKTGGGTLTLAGTSTYSGTTSVGAGVLRAQADGALGTGAVSVATNAVLQMQGDISLANPLSLAGTGVSASGSLLSLSGDNSWTGPITLASSTHIGVAADTLEISGNISGAALQIHKYGAGKLILSGDNSFGAGVPIDVRGGILNIRTDTALGNSSYCHVYYSTAALELQDDITVSNDLYIKGFGAGGAGSLRSLSGNNTWNGFVRMHSGGPDAAIGVDAGTLTINGIVQNHGGTQGALTKLGDGTLILARAAGNTYSGGTTLTAGTLLANNTSGSATGTGAVTVTGGTLGGTGSIAGPVTFTTGGMLSPGASIGTLTTGDLTLSDASNSLFELAAPWQFGVSTGSTPNDLVIVNGDLVLDGSLTVTPVDILSSGIYTLFTYTGSVSGDFDSLLFSGGYGGSISIDSVNGAVNLNLVPEPSTLAMLLGLAGLGLLGYLRRRNKGS